MKSLGAILFISAAVFFAAATDGQGANWVFYGESETGGFRSYYDSDSVTGTPVNKRVWTKRIYSDRQKPEYRGPGEKDAKTDRIEATQKQSFDEMHTRFEKENPGFRHMWNRGEIQNYMATHPGLSPAAAYRELTFTPRTTMMLFELNCKNREITFVSLTEYDSRSQLRRSTTSTKDEQLAAPIIPESMNENLFKNVCATQKPGAEGDGKLNAGAGQ